MFPPLRRRLKVSALFRLRCRARSEVHTSELQSRVDLVCRLLLEKKNTIGQIMQEQRHTLRRHTDRFTAHANVNYPSNNDLMFRSQVYAHCGGDDRSMPCTRAPKK